MRTISYKSLYFVHPSLELVPLFTGMWERSIVGSKYNDLPLHFIPLFSLLFFPFASHLLYRHVFNPVSVFLPLNLCYALFLCTSNFIREFHLFIISPSRFFFFFFALFLCTSSLGSGHLPSTM